MYSGMKYNGAEKIVFLKKFVKWHHADLPITTIASDFMWYPFFFAIVVLYMECVESFHTTNMVFKFISFHKPQQEDEQNFQATVTI